MRRGGRRGVVAGRCGVFESRSVTVVSGDVCDYCSHMAQDDQATLMRLHIYRNILKDLVQRMNGRMFGVAGDSWMAEFAAPADALICAIECQRAIEAANTDLPKGKRIHYRLGIHCGTALLDDEGALFGDPVNIAARLQAASQPGHITISDDLHRHINGILSVKFRALGPLRLKHIAFPVSAHAIETEEIFGAGFPEDRLPAVDVSMPVPGFEGRAAVAVLPFEVSGGSSGREYLGEGFADGLVNGLSNVRTFPIIARESSFVFKRYELDSRSIGRALGASYLVSGCMRLMGEELRLSVNLIDAENGVNLWSDHYRIDFSKLFEVQDEITLSIVSMIDTEVDRAVQLRCQERKPEVLCAWDLLRRGIWHLNKFTKQDSAAAFVCFEEALRREPSSSEANIQLAWWHFWDIWTRRGDLSGMSRTERHARDALRNDPRDARGHLLAGIALMMTKRPAQGRASFWQAVELNPSLAAAHSCIGSSYVLEGTPAKGIEPLLLSIRLNPYNPFAFHFLGELGIAFYMQREWDKAIEFAERSLQLRPGYWYAKAVLIASLARAGQIRQAEALAGHSCSNFSLEGINWLPFIDKKWNDYLLDGLKLAGCVISDPRLAGLPA